MENICGVYFEQASEPRYHFILDNGQDSLDPSVNLYLVREDGGIEAKLLSLVNRGGSWRLLLAHLSDEFMEKFGDNFDLDGEFLFPERDSR